MDLPKTHLIQNGSFMHSSLIVRQNAKESYTRKCDFSESSRSVAHALGEPAATVLSSYLVWLVRIVGSSSD